MFLTLIRFAKRLKTEEHGAALAAVIGMMLVGILLTTLVASSVISGSGQTAATRAGVQAQAAAEAGIAAAYAGFKAGTCTANGGVYTSATAPVYRATVWNGAAIGCPSSGTVRIVSTGTAESTGVAGNSSGNKAYLEATYAAGASQSSGSAVYIYNGGAVNAFSINLGPGVTQGNIRIPSGNFSCTTASTINGDVVVAAGTIYLTNSCKITGSARASGQITMDSSAQVLGDVVSSGGLVSLQTNNYIKGNVYANGSFTENGGTIDGSVQATGDAYLGSGARIKGTLTAGGTLTRIEGLVDGNVTSKGTGTTTFVPGALRVGGSFTVGGDLDSWNYDNNLPTSGSTTNQKIAYNLKAQNWVTGTVTFRATGLTAPTAQTAPVVPGWVDWGYTRSDWVSAGFPNEIVWPSTSCSINNYDGTDSASALYPTVQAMKNITVPTVINALGCSNLNFSNSAALDLKFGADVAFVSKSFTFGGVKMDSNNATDRKAYFLVPDGQPTTAGAHCNNGSGSVSMDSATIVGSHLAAMLYTPCNISVNNGSLWRGQLYSQTISVSANDAVTYVPVGIPGKDLDGGVASPGAGGIGALVSLRNLTNNGE